VDLAVKETNDPGIRLEVRTILDRGRGLAGDATSSPNIKEVSQALRRAESEFRQATRADLDRFERRIRIQESRDAEKQRTLAAGNQAVLSSMKEAEIAGREAGYEVSLTEGLAEHLAIVHSAVGTTQRAIMVSIRDQLKIGGRVLLMHRLWSIGRAAARHAWRVVFGFGVLTLWFGIVTDAAALVIGNIVALAAVWCLQEYVLGPRLKEWLERKERRDLAVAALRIHHVGAMLLALRRMVSQQLSMRDERAAQVVGRSRATRENRDLNN
jgi:hypothetical protein